MGFSGGISEAQHAEGNSNSECLDQTALVAVVGVGEDEDSTGTGQGVILAKNIVSFFLCLGISVRFNLKLMH